MKLYEGSKQYNCKADLWEAIKTTMSETEPTGVKKLTKSMGKITGICQVQDLDDRLLAIIEKGYYIKM